MFKGFSENGNSLVFSLDDVPVQVSSQAIALMKIPNSLILRIESICRVEGDYAEGDIVHTDNGSGILFFNERMKAKLSNGKVIDLSELDVFAHEPGSMLTARYVDSLEERAPIMFKYLGSIFSWSNFTVTHGKKILLYQEHFLVKSSDILVSKGKTEDGFIF